MKKRVGWIILTLLTRLRREDHDSVGIVKLRNCIYTSVIQSVNLSLNFHTRWRDDSTRGLIQKPQCHTLQQCCRRNIVWRYPPLHTEKWKKSACELKCIFYFSMGISFSMAVLANENVYSPLDNLRYRWHEHGIVVRAIATLVASVHLWSQLIWRDPHHTNANHLQHLDGE